jgi:pseudomonalisin
VINDLRQFETTFGLTQVPVNITSIDNGTSSTDTSGADEFDLDTQYSTGFAPGVSSETIYDMPDLANTSIVDAINAFANDAAVPQASLSAGECEVLADVGGLLAPADAALEQAVAEGKSFFTSAGDTGGFCPAVVGVNGVPAGLPNVGYPASSPFAIGVGGTSIVNLPSASEITWAPTGGGISLLESQPAFQAGAGGSLLPVQRGVPDVALDADPNLSPYMVIVNGTEEGVGGTSAGAPSWQGIWARAQGAKGGGLGFAGPVLYKTEPASAYHDVIVGDNVPFPATPGWDYTTGLGTPDITAIVNGA